jgi:hypothetical protein
MIVLLYNDAQLGRAAAITASMDVLISYLYSVLMNVFLSGTEVMRNGEEGE